jgi:hypothetical protein
MTPQGGGWYVDVYSEQWDGPPLASCTRIWEALPPIGGPPPWLGSPEGHLQLASEEPYFYLAGRLIANGLVDVSTCPTGGRLPNGYADACGLEIARPLVDYWQNQFDERIPECLTQHRYPGPLMKNLFAQESRSGRGFPCALGVRTGANNRQWRRNAAAGTTVFRAVLSAGVI